MAGGHGGDRSNGYEEFAETFMRARNGRIGPATVREWSRRLPRGATVLELACGYGVISEVLIGEGFDLYAMDASPTLLAEFGRRYPGVSTECAGVEDSDFFGRKFDAVVAWGLMFLLPEPAQRHAIAKVGRALNPGGRFLFTSPREVHSWKDALTGRESVSLGAEEYERLLTAAGFDIEGHASDEGNNFYYFARLRAD
jgi:SAM-dependent methyltransferase